MWQSSMGNNQIVKAIFQQTVTSWRKMFDCWDSYPVLQDSENQEFENKLCVFKKFFRTIKGFKVI